jgi:cytochrome c oxidase assembly protein subunit 15
MLVAAGLGGLGAAVGRTGGETERQREGETDGRSRSRRPAVPPSLSPAFWTGVLARVAVAATLLLLIAGGLVTSKEAGLAVVDWPNSFGYNMFLYPLSRMTGGVYYEHAHRLLGSLVGLTTLVLAAHLQRTERRAWLRRFGWAALAVVIVQGVMGGLRVTGSFTLSTAAADTRPSIGLAILHGVLGQMFFGMMVAISVFTSTRWQAAPEPVSAASARTDQVFSIVLVAALVVQLLLGALVRHIALGLLIHVSAAVIVVLIALTCGARAWGLYPQQGVLNRLGRSLMGLTAGQVVLGLSALFATGLLIGEPAPVPRLLDVMLTTAHQAVGAILLACAVALMLWTHRALSPLEAPASASAGFPEAARPVSREVEPYA